MQALDGFWGWQVSATRVSDLIPLPGGHGCLSNECTTFNSCSGNRVGAFCGACPPAQGFRLFSTSCYPNENCWHSTVWFVPVLIIAIVIYAMILLYRQNNQRSAIVGKSVFVSMVSFYQVQPLRQRPLD